MKLIPKNLLLVQGKPLLRHVIDQWQDKVDSFIFIMRRETTYLWEYLPPGAAIVFQDDPRGLADAILRAEPYCHGQFVVALGDCLTVGRFQVPRGLGIGVWRTDNEYEVKKSYAVRVSRELVMQVEEKPQCNATGLCGMGTYFMDGRLFEYIRRWRGMVPPGGGDLTEILQLMIDDGLEIRPAWFEGVYVNVNLPQDIVLADEQVGRLAVNVK